MISVIVPALNEEATIGAALDSAISPKADQTTGAALDSAISPAPDQNIGAVLDSAIEPIELIVVDGGSTDRTIAIAEAAGALVLQSIPNKGAQHAAGAGVASGDILLFLHCDTLLPATWRKDVRAAVGAGCVGGAFRLTFPGGDAKLRRLERWVERRNRWTGIPYGDQAIFATRVAYDRAGGFRPLPIMDDFDFVCRLERTGRLALLESPVLNSPRRYLRLGVIRTVLLNQLIIAGYFLGVSPDELARWYRR